MGKHPAASVGVRLITGKHVLPISITRKHQLKINVSFFSASVDYKLIPIKKLFYRN